MCRLAYTWRSGPADTLMSWTLDAEGDTGTCLRLSHDGFDPQDRGIRELLEGGWRERSGPLLKELVGSL